MPRTGRSFKRSRQYRSNNPGEDKREAVLASLFYCQARRDDITCEFCHRVVHLSKRESTIDGCRSSIGPGTLKQGSLEVAWYGFKHNRTRHS